MPRIDLRSGAARNDVTFRAEAVRFAVKTSVKWCSVDGRDARHRTPDKVVTGLLTSPSQRSACQVDGILCSGLTLSADQNRNRTLFTGLNTDTICI